MTALVHRHPASTAAKTTFPELSPRLRAALETSDVDAGRETIVGDPVLVREASVALPAMRAAALAPAGEAGVRRVVGSRMATFPPMEMTEGQWAAWWRDYVDVLGGLTEAQLEHGMRLYLREPGSDFLPKPWKLLALAKGATTTAATLYDRAKAAVDEAMSSATRPNRQPVDPAQVDTWMADWRASMAAKREARGEVRRPEATPVSAAVGETGVSDELRQRTHGV